MDPPTTSPSGTESAQTVPTDEEKQQPPLNSKKEQIVQWDGVDDPLNPQSMSVLRKWLIILIVSLGSLLV